MSEVVERVKLFHREGRSDKVYEIELVADGDGLFHVVGYNGRRGARLVAQPKTQFPVPYATARRIFDNLEQAKLNHRKTPYRLSGRERFDRPTPAADTAEQPSQPTHIPKERHAESYQADHLDALEL
jgi:bifunctional non-homologous end joining protein LigD